MFFLVFSQLDIDFSPYAFWIEIALWLVVFRIFILPMISAFVRGARSGHTGAPQDTVRVARNGRFTHRKLPAPFRLKDAYVIDGDTLSRGDWRIRIYGMDAPESDQPGGAASTARLNELVSGKTLHILPKDVDIYGRLVARVRCGPLDIGAEMVKSGHAVATSDFTHAYTGAEKTARRTRQGLWKSGRIDDPKAWRDAQK